MATATIDYPKGQHATAGKKLEIVVKYIGPDPVPDDYHVLTRTTGGGDFTKQFGGDIPPGVAPRAGLPLNFPVGDDTGTFDLRVDWTWKPERRETGTDQGQYFVDPPQPPAPPPADPPDEDKESTPLWKILLAPLTLPVEGVLLILYTPFWLLDLLGFGSPIERALAKLLKAIRDNLLPPPFSGWGF